MQIISNPFEVMYFLSKDENAFIFGLGRKITFCLVNNPANCCVQLRQFFTNKKDSSTIHYEIEKRGEAINVEIHSETKTPRDVHEFIQNQFNVNHQLKMKRKNNSYRFGTHPIIWQGKSLDDVVQEIKKAIDELYRKYDAYLNYVEGWYEGKKSIDGCKAYEVFMK